MATIRDLVSLLRRREGVDAAVVLGRDGLLIDGATGAPFDPEGLAALVPPLVLASAELARAADRGAFGLMVLEHARGPIVVSALSADAYLLVLMQPHANLAALLYELRAHREQIAALV